MFSIGEMCRMSGLTARALRYYDAAGLLRPQEITRSGYRLYDRSAVARARQILAYRATGMRLGEIRAVLDSKDPNRARSALRNRLMELHQEQARLDRMVHSAERALADAEQTQEGQKMDEQLRKEAQQRWGESDAYKDYVERLEKNGAESMELAGTALMEILASFGELRGAEPGGPEAQEIAEKLHKHMSANFYKCSPQMLAGLGEMYVEDPRFQQNIDEKGGEGTAAFARDAIRAYCAARPS